MYRNLIVIITFFLILVFSGSKIPSVFAQTSCTNELQQEANRYLNLAHTFEDQGEWQKAADYYEKAALSPCANQSLSGNNGLNRVLSKQNNWGNQYKNNLEKVSLSFGIYTLQFASLIILTLLIVRLLIWRISRNKQWIIMPLEDYTNKNQGEAIAGIMVSTIHNIRLLHSDKPIGLIGPSENVDMPSFTGVSYRNTMLTALDKFNSFDVSGMGLPIGSMISSVVHWFDLGRPHLHGFIRKNGDRIEITIRREEGREGRCTKLWKASETIDKDNGESVILNKLIEQLCYRIILEATTEGWGTSSHEALHCYTNGLLSLHRFYESQSRDLAALDEARSAFYSALRIDTTYSLATYNLALVELNDGNYERAIELLKSLISVTNQQNSTEIYYNLGVAYYHLTRDWAYDKAEEAFNIVIDRQQKDKHLKRNREILALTYCSLIAIAAQKSRLDRRNSNGFYQTGQQYYRKAIDLLTKEKSEPRILIKQNGSDRNSNKMIEAQAKYSLAILNLNSQYLEPAGLLLNEAITLNPYHWRAYTALGQLEMAQDHPQEAITALLKATILSPEYEFAHYLLGRAYVSLGKTEMAISEFSKAPSNARAFDEWGRILAKNGDYQDAIERFEAAIHINSQLADAYANIAWYLVEGGLIQGDGLKRAEQAAKRAIELSKEQPSYWHKLAVLGHVYYFGGKIDEANKVLNDALLENQKAAQVFYYLALTNSARGDYQAAREKLIAIFKLEERGIWHEKASKLMKELKDKEELARQSESQNIQVEQTNDSESITRKKKP